MIIDIELSKVELQKDWWSCGIHNVALAVRLKTGQETDFDEIKAELGATESGGTDLLAIEKYFSIRPEYKMKAKTGWTLEEIGEELKAGRGCIVAYQNWQKPEDMLEEDWGHYGIVYKIENERVYLFDPGSEETDGLSDFSIEEFTKRWWEDDFNESYTDKVRYPQWAVSLDLSREEP